MALLVQAILVGVLIAVVVVGCGLWIMYKHYRPSNEPELFFNYPTRSYYIIGIIVRSFCCVYYIVILITELIENNGLSIYKWYTIWNFTLQLVYFLGATKFQWSHRSIPSKTPILMTKTYHRLNTLFDWSFSCSFIVAIVFWTLLYGPNYNLTWYSVCEHAVNNVLLFIEFSINDFYVHTSSIVYACLLWPALYAAWACFSNITWLNGVWTYNFLNLDKPTAIGWYIGVLVGHFVLFGVAYLLSLLKQRLKPSVLVSPETLHTQKP
ncbi:hypothetical protein THRCLA_00805 [Thraustotheca clavata]|uniref:Uncharacterized protein n=1 Tax=Thraustotheca clavata TaxID=74557 RepID=A0A1W0AAH4_9STRA|nr:hypothetical protein THRCLA_00805 [Thraustotheca clavata]